MSMKRRMRFYAGSEFDTIASKVYTSTHPFLRPEDSEDVLQDVLLELWSCSLVQTTAPDWRSQVLHAFGLIIARSRRRDLIRHINCLKIMSYMGDRYLLDHLPDPAGSPSVQATLEFEEELAALVKLEDPEVSAALQRFHHECSYAELAHASNLSESGARTRVLRGRSKLRRRLRSSGE